MTQTTKVEKLVRQKIECYRDFRIEGHMIVNLFEQTSEGTVFSKERYYPVKQLVFDSVGQGFILRHKGMEDAVGGAVGTPQETRIPLAVFEIVPYGADSLEIQVNHNTDPEDGENHHYDLIVRSRDRYEDSTKK